METLNLNQVIKWAGIALIIPALTFMSILLLTFPFCASAPYRDVSPQTIEYAIDPSIQGIERAVLMGAVNQATAMWMEQNSELKFVLTDKRNVLQIQTGVPWFAQLAGGTTDGFTKCPIWDTDATNCVVYLHQDLLDPDLGKYMSPKIQLTNTLAHELGHVVGLGHYPDIRANHLMGTPEWNPSWTSTDTKGYVVPEPIPLL